MGRYEITRAQFGLLMQADPVIMSDKTAFSSGMGDPVLQVSWYHAIAFCNKLSLREGLTPVYRVVTNGSPVEWANIKFFDIPQTNDSDWDAVTANWTNDGYRLPTEMEWMWAALGAPAEGQDGGVDTTGYLKAYAGSTEGTNTTRLGDYAWYSANALNKTHPAGSKKANERGLFDMTGNVTELCWDWWSASPVSGLLTDYRGAGPGDYRVTKGGSWGDDPDEVAISRSSNPWPEWRDMFIGFRVVRK